MKAYLISFFALLLLLTACTNESTPPPPPSSATPTIVSTVAPTQTRVPTSLPLPSPTKEGAGGEAPTRAPYKLGAPLPQRATPRTLIDAQDIARMKQWAAAYAWARDARDQIIQNADAYPSKYLKDFNLASPDLPPTGGQWTLWYICPDGTNLRYEPTHSPPHFCPSTNQYYASPLQWGNRPTLYDEVIYARRHNALAEYARNLGLAYALTGEKKYAESAAAILRVYAAAYPNYPQHDKDGKSTKSGGKTHAQTLDEAIWLIDIAWSYDLINDTLSPADRTTIADKLLRPAVAVIQGNRAKLSNWQTWHNAAIAAVGFALEDAKMVNDAYYDPENGFFAQIEQGAAQDGFWWEGSWGYHFFTLQPMLYLAEMGTHVGIDTYAQQNLRAMLMASLQMMQPDLTLPRFNDDGETSLAGGGRDWLYEIGYNRYRDLSMPALVQDTRPWQALLWGAETLPTASAMPSVSSTLLPKAGYAILRAGDARDARYLAFKFAPHGGGHGHYDKLGYITYGLGRVLALDPGTHSYAATSHNGWDKTTIAHNTVVVDETTQAEATGSLHRFLGFSALGLATADAGPAYPNRAAITRTLALTSDYWLDVTRVSSLDGKPHRFDWVYHNPGTLTTPLTLTTYTAFPGSNGYNFLINPKASMTNSDWQATWDLTGVGQAYGSVYRNKDDVVASFTLARAGEGLAGQLDYDFGSAADGYAVYSTRELDRMPVEAPSRMGVRIYGDDSDNRLAFRIIDATGEKFIKDAGVIHWTGWQAITIVVDRTWSHSAGNNDGRMDLPVRQVAVQISRTNNGAPGGRILIEEIVLNFPSAGRQVVEDFETASAHVAVTMLGATDTTVVVGNGIDQANQLIPFTMARRQAKDTTFATVFEPYRLTPRVTEFQAAGAGWRVIAPSAFTDSFLLSDGTARGERTFGTFSTDATVAYVRQDRLGSLQTLVLANATKFSEGARTLITSTAPVTAQVIYAGDTLAVATPNVTSTQVRVFARNMTKASVNDKPVAVQREGEYLIFRLAAQ